MQTAALFYNTDIKLSRTEAAADGTEEQQPKLPAPACQQVTLLNSNVPSAFKGSDDVGLIFL